MAELSYDIQGEPDYRQRSYNWKTAIGLQQVDQLVPSQYLIEAANKNINGELSLEQVREQLEQYYDARPALTKDEHRQEEADKVSQRIAELLATDAFTLSHIELLGIHKHLFTDLYEFAGKIRDYNIGKSEWVLHGLSVNYGDARNIQETLKYDIEKEQQFDYSSLQIQEAINHLIRFIAALWQIHPFGEGNTRTIAVFTIKYLRTKGFTMTNEPFEQHSWYFRNALVRASYSNIQEGFAENYEFLNKFFGNMLLDQQNELKNRSMQLEL